MALSDADHRFLAACITLAENGRFSTTPNPNVGCVLVKHGRVIGRGWTQPAGQAHAEAVALANASEPAAGATCYVSLEPCSHYGRTPPCADALIAAGVARVVVGLGDPNPEVGGNGVAKLRAAGIAVDMAELPAVRDQLAGYIKRVSEGLPWVRLKVAASLDGRTAMRSGESQWITGAAARADVQYWRARSSAVLTGIGTVLADDPLLTVRDARYAAGGTLRQPLRVVLDRRLRTPADAALFSAPAPVLILTTTAAAASDVLAQQAEIVTLAGGGLALGDVLPLLGARGCNEVLVECGAELTGEFLRLGCWDEMILYLAPKFLGSGARALADIEIERLADARGGRIGDVAVVGGDLRLRIVNAGA